MKIYQIEVSTRWSYRMIGVVVEKNGETLVKYVNSEELNRIEFSDTSTVKLIRKAIREKTIVTSDKIKLIEVTKTYIDANLEHKRILALAFRLYVKGHKEVWERTYPIRLCDKD